MPEKTWSRETCVGPADLPSMRFIHIGRHTHKPSYDAVHQLGGGATQLAIRTHCGAGEVTVQTPDGEQRLRLDEGSVLLSNDTDLLTLRSLCRWDLTWIDFSVDLPEMFPWHRVMHVRESARERADLCTLTRATNSDQLWARREATGLLFALMSRWIVEDKQGPTAEDPAIAIEKALRFVYEDLSRVVSVDNMAEVAGMTTTVFRRHFRQVMGVTPKHYYDRLRMEAAMRLLLKGTSVKEVAKQVGFSDAFHFTRAYRRMYNIAPKRVRKLLDFDDAMTSSD